MCPAGELQAPQDQFALVVSKMLETVGRNELVVPNSFWPCRGGFRVRIRRAALLSSFPDHFASLLCRGGETLG